MKKLSFFLMFFVTAVVYGQNPDTLTQVAPYEVFPVGAIRAPVADTLERMLGMNFNWYGFNTDNTSVAWTLQRQPIDNTSELRDPFYWDDTTVRLVPTSKWLLAAGCYGVDVRVYMPGTDPVVQDYTYKWNTNTGETFGTTEWQIRIDNVDSGDYVLSDLTGGQNAKEAPYSHGGEGQGYQLDDAHIGKFSYEFVYLLDSLDLLSVDNSDPLYTLEYLLTRPDGTDTLLGTDIITKSSYNALAIANTNAPGHEVDAEKLAEWDGQRNNNKFYRIQKRIFDLRPFYTSTSGPYPKVEVRLMTHKRIPIYVRLLRIRDWVGQQLLTGKADSVLNLAIDALLDEGLNNDEIKSWTFGNEQGPKNFHAWGYIQDLLYAKDAPQANILSIGNFDLAQRVLRDQTQYYERGNGILWYQWTPYLGNHWRNTDTLTGGIPYRRWHYLDYQSYPFSPMPLPFATGGDTISPMLRGIHIADNYENYTYRWQEQIIGYNSENIGGGTGDAQVQFTNARACYFHPTRPQPYYLSAQANPYRWSAPKFYVDSLRLLLYYDLISQGASTDDAADSSNHWAADYYDSTIISPYLSTHQNDIVLSEDSLFDPIWAKRPTTRPEAFFQFWNGVQHGMKGYVVNLAYDDGIIQNGILFDSTVNEETPNEHDSIIRSHERLGITILESWANPYDGSRNQSSRKRFLALPPGFKPMYNAFRDIITQELAPIARTLAELRWKGSVSWHKRDSVPYNMTLLPVKDVMSRSLLDSLDPAAKTYVDLGIHEHPDDTAATYITVLNRRLWCNEANTDTTDVRIVTFKIDTAKFPGYEQFNLYSITNLVEHKETIVHKDSLYAIRLQPGQGRLLRIAPAVGLARFSAVRPFP